MLCFVRGPERIVKPSTPVGIVSIHFPASKEVCVTGVIQPGARDREIPNAAGTRLRAKKW